MSNQSDDLLLANAHVARQGDVNTEIQHPTDLIGTSPYFELTLLLVQLDVLSADIHLITSSFWDGYEY